MAADDLPDEAPEVSRDRAMMQANGVSVAEREVDPSRAVARFVRDDDDEAIAEFLVRCFDDGWPRHEIACSTAEHVTWKLSSNPEMRAKQSLVVHEADDRYLIAAGIRVACELWIAGRVVDARQGGDAAVHPDWRLRRVRDIRREFRDEHGLRTHAVSLDWLAQHPATRKEGLRNPEVAHQMVDLFRPGSLRSRIAVPRANGGWRHAVHTVLDAIGSRSRGRRTPRFGGDVVALERFDERTDAVWELAQQEFDVAIVRDQRRQNWRYADPRAGRYEIRAAVEGDELIGYAALSPHADPAAILDLLVRPGRLDAVDALVGDALERVRASAADEGRSTPDLHCWLPERHPYVGAVRARGFVDCGLTPSLRYNARSLTDAEIAVLDDPQTAIHVTNGDSDFI